MGSRHSKQNRFAGSVGSRQRVPQGGVAYVRPEDTISAGGCWCQGEICEVRDGQTWWPGVEEGAPHPRQRLSDKQEEVVTMTAEPEAPAKIAPGDIPGFSKMAKALILEIVNDHGIKYRVIDGGHILLYPPVKEDRPFKVSASRQDRMNQQILEVQFMERYGLRPKGSFAQHPAKAKPEDEKSPPTPKAVKPLVIATKPEPTVEPDTEGEMLEQTLGLEEKVREAIAVLHDALGIEDEAVEAIVGYDELKAERDAAVLKAAKATTESNALRDALTNDRADLARLREDALRKDKVIQGLKERAETAEADMAALRKILGKA